MEYVVPGLIILIGNLLSGPHGTITYEIVTACYGWAAVFSLSLWMLVSVFFSQDAANTYLIPVFGLCLIQALSRDYEKMLRPIVDKLLGR